MDTRIGVIGIVIDEISAMTGRLGKIQGVNVKSALTKKLEDE